MAKSVDAYQTGSTLIASIFKFVSNVWQLFAADDFSRPHYQMHFFSLRVLNCTCLIFCIFQAVVYLSYVGPRCSMTTCINKLHHEIPSPQFCDQVKVLPICFTRST